jgi:hypothetical protein
LSRLRSGPLTHFPLEIGNRRAKAIEPGLFEAIEARLLECELFAAQTSLESRSVALRFGQGELALTLVVTLEDGQHFSGLYVLPLDDAHLFHPHARSGPERDRP